MNLKSGRDKPNEILSEKRTKPLFKLLESML